MKAACAVMNSGITGTGNPADYEVELRAFLPLEYQEAPLSYVVDRHAGRAANAMAIADVNGGLERWYVQYCVLKP